MTFLPRLPLLLVVLCCVFTGAWSAAAAEQGNKYGQWQSSDDRMEGLINDLDRIIDEGTRSRAAHPGFLEDLNTIIDRYRAPKKLIFFTDDFADNNFTENPAWIVSQGAFSIDAYGALYSSIAASKPAAARETGSDSDKDRNLRILLGVLNELTKEEKTEQNQKEEIKTQAVISSAAAIANSFTLEYSFRSNGDWGATSIGVIHDGDPQSGYHLVYQASPAENRPMQLIKYRYGKIYIIDEVRENSPNLDDGADHTVRFTRSPNGDMTVQIDGVEMMRAADLSFRNDFTGVMIKNSGGSYSYDNIEFYIEQ